jgi:beta-phosphoglucomutase-like phosphatase (HAD superfamily)
MSIEAIFLGLDGVLFDTEAQHLAACNAAFAHAGLSIRWTLPALRAAARTHGYARAIGSAIAGESLARDKAAVAQLFQTKHAIFQQAVTQQPPLASASALTLIVDALEAGCKLSVLSDLPAPVSALLLEQCFGPDVNSLFTVVSGGVSFEGPSGTGPYARALHAMSIEPAAAVVVDTAAPSLRAAQESGLWTVSVAPFGEIVRPQQFITFDALRDARSPFSANPLREVRAGRAA